jgi:hypothetical protein
MSEVYIYKYNIEHEYFSRHDNTEQWKNITKQHMVKGPTI